MESTSSRTSMGASRRSFGSGTIDQQYLAPFAYYGVHDGLDLQDVPWRKGVGYDVDALTNVFTADHAWVRRVLEQIRAKVADPGKMRALGFCVSVAHAHFMAGGINKARGSPGR